MPPWVTALVVLVLLAAFGAYVVTEGFATARTACTTTYNTCFKACASSDSTCIQACGDAQTTCLRNAAAAASVANTDPLHKGNASANMQWAASVAPGAQGNSSNTSNAYMAWTNSAGSSTSIPKYSTDLSRVYNSSTSSNTPAPSELSATPASVWDGNKDTYSTGWPQQTFNLQDDGSYDSSSPTEGSYIVNVKRWKPHETPTQEAPGLKAHAPTDEGTEAADLQDSRPSLTQMIRDDSFPSDSFPSNSFPSDSFPSESLQQLISEDVKNTVNGLFTNQYEIQYA